MPRLPRPARAAYLLPCRQPFAQRRRAEWLGVPKQEVILSRALNPHPHFHVRVIDGLFAPEGESGVRFVGAGTLDSADAEVVQTQVRRRVSRAYQRRGLLDRGEREEMVAPGFLPPATLAHPCASDGGITAADFRSMLLARIYEVIPLTCDRCGAEMRIIAFVTEGAEVRKILEHVGEP